VSKATLPDSWATATLDQISVRLGRGKSPKYTEKSNAFVANQRCVYWEGLRLENVRPVHAGWFESLSDEIILRDGDILLNSTGTGTLGRAIVWSGTKIRCVPDSHVTQIRLPDGFSSRFYAYYLRSERGQKLIDSSTTGSTNQIELNRGRFAAGIVPVPPKQEQARIVSKIESCFSRIDAVEKSVAKAETLLESLWEAMFETLIGSFDTAPLSDYILDKPRNGYSPKPSQKRTAIKTLTLGATTSGWFDPEKYKYVDEIIPSESHLWLYDGDILIQRSNSLEHVGVSAVYRGPENTL
jgi:type I restriction enzyme S subunit